MPGWFSESRTFLQQNIANFKHTGSMVPSSRSLCRALSYYVRNGDDGAGATRGPRRVLEVGPGTGPVTKHICEQLRPDDTLELCELNEQFVAILRRKFAEEPPFCDVASRVAVHHTPIESLPGDEPFDLIVSGLPLNNFEIDEVEHILNLFGRLLKPTGTLSFFEYIGINKLRVAVNGAAGRKRLRGVSQTLTDFLRRGEIRRDHIWANFPPAYVHHVRFAPKPR